MRAGDKKYRNYIEKIQKTKGWVFLHVNHEFVTKNTWNFKKKPGRVNVTVNFAHSLTFT